MTDSDTPPGPPEPEPPGLRALRRLVTSLTLVLIAGMISITALLAWRLAAPPSGPGLPDKIALPADERLTGAAVNDRWTVLITRDSAGTERLHLVRAGATTIHQTTVITPVE